MAIIISLFFIAIGVAGIGRLYAYCIQPGQIFDFMQSVLVWLQTRNKFWFKRLGGCAVCTIQNFIDITFLFVWWHLHTFLNWYQLLGSYLFLSGIAFYFYALIENTKHHEQTELKTETETIEL
jgi:hypothetical protein